MNTFNLFIASFIAMVVLVLIIIPLVQPDFLAQQESFCKAAGRGTYTVDYLYGCDSIVPLMLIVFGTALLTAIITGTFALIPPWGDDWDVK